jgi:hypothetical protein
MRLPILAAGLACAAAPAFAADPVEGEWLTQSGSGKVRSRPAREAGRDVRRITWLKNPPTQTAKDDQQPRPAAEARPSGPADDLELQPAGPASGPAARSTTRTRARPTTPRSR